MPPQCAKGLRQLFNTDNDPEDLRAQTETIYRLTLHIYEINIGILSETFSLKTSVRSPV